MLKCCHHPQVLEKIRSAMGESLWDYELLFNSDFPVRH
jgi:hypothetical protein